AKVAAGTCAVLDQHLLAEQRRQALCGKAGQRVRGASRRERHDDAQRLRRLREHLATHEQEEEEQCSHAGTSTPSDAASARSSSSTGAGSDRSSVFFKAFLWPRSPGTRISAPSCGGNALIAPMSRFTCCLNSGSGRNRATSIAMTSAFW